MNHKLSLGTSSRRAVAVLATRICLALWLAASAHAALISYDGADYAPANSISGFNGGTGWNGGWIGANRVVAGSLFVNGVATSCRRFHS